MTIWKSITSSYILLERGLSDTLTYFNNFLGFNEFDQICHKLSLVTGHHHFTPGMISGKLERKKNANNHHDKQTVKFPKQYPSDKTQRNPRKNRYSYLSHFR